MRSKFGSKILVGLLYGQALFGLVAVGAVVAKDYSPSTRAAVTDARQA